MPSQTDLLIERGGNVTIVAANLSLLDIAVQGDELAEAIGAAAPISWPPEHNDAAMFAWVRRLIEKYPDEPGYNTWFIIGDGQLCGSCGYKGPPGDDGSVEIGYSVIPEAQRRGFATGAVDLLVTRAFRDPRVTAVRAETSPDGIASQMVLLRCGFARTGIRIDPDDGKVLCFERQAESVVSEPESTKHLSPLQQKLRDHALTKSTEERARAMEPLHAILRKGTSSYTYTLDDAIEETLRRAIESMLPNWGGGLGKSVTLPDDEAGIVEALLGLSTADSQVFLWFEAFVPTSSVLVSAGDLNYGVFSGAFVDLARAVGHAKSTAGYSPGWNRLALVAFDYRWMVWVDGLDAVLCTPRSDSPFSA